MAAPHLSLIDWSLYGVTFANLALALVVLRHAPKREENRVFAVTCVSVALWALTNALFRTTASQAHAVLWAQLSYAAALALGASFLHFSWIYPQRSSLRWPGAKLLLWMTALCITGLAFVPGAVLEEVNLTERRIHTAHGIWLIATFMVATSVWAFGLFWHSQARLHRVAREQARYVLLGAAFTAVLGLTFNLALPLTGNYHWVWAGPVCSLFFVGFTVYSIVAHHLFDIRILIRRTLVYSLLLSAMAAAFSGLEFVLTRAVGLVVGEDHALIAHLMTGVIVSLYVQPLRQALEHWVHRLLFRKKATGSAGH